MSEKYRIALAGCPNVGKSTLFNALTGMKQHTGNWSGKTVSGAEGVFLHNDNEFTIIDVPGIYSLRSSSAEEKAAEDIICFGGADAVIVVCDALCLERSLNLVFQVCELAERVIVCVNLMDEAEKKGVKVDIPKLEAMLGVSVIGMAARSGNGISELADELCRLLSSPPQTHSIVSFSEEIETATAKFSTPLNNIVENSTTHAIALRILCGDAEFIKRAAENGMPEFIENAEISEYMRDDKRTEKMREAIIAVEMKRAAEIAEAVTEYGTVSPFRFDRAADRMILSRKTGIPIMLLLFGIIMWITVTGANYPSELLSRLLFGIGNKMSHGLLNAGAPEWLEGVLIQGIYKVLAWVVSVMLPPMAIFFPLFTILEDIGLLPRIAFNLDPCFQCADACGKQAITMAMGLGCNACGITGCRIIDSPRERLIAVLTNCFVPCNGRFPTIIAVIAMFFSVSHFSGIFSACMLLAVILLGVIMTLLVSKLLSVTVLKGKASSFTLELPPYRRPQIGRIIVRSLLDRTVFVLGRACTAAAPCGLIIWLAANIRVGNVSFLSAASGFLEPVGHIMGLDGVILLGFILGFPANETVLPIIMMTYLSQGTLSEITDNAEIFSLLTAHGWTVETAVCMLLLVLFHFPCATACMTIKKETGSLKWTAVSMLLPTLIGFILCTAVHLIMSL